MYRTHPRLQDHTYGRYTGQGRAHTDTHVHYTSPPIRPHIWQVRRSGTCTHRHTCTVHIPAYKTAHMAGAPVRDVHTQTDKYYTHSESYFKIKYFMLSLNSSKYSYLLTLARSSRLLFLFFLVSVMPRLLSDSVSLRVR